MSAFFDSLGFPPPQTQDLQNFSAYLGAFLVGALPGIIAIVGFTALMKMFMNDRQRLD